MLDELSNQALSSSNFNIVRADGKPLTQTDVNNFQAMLNYNSGSSIASAGLASEEIGAAYAKTFVLITNGNDQTSLDGKTIYWDPNAAHAVYDANGNLIGVQSSTIAFDHEAIGHGLDLSLGSETSAQAEAYAIGKEDLIVAQLGEDGRTTNSADPYFHQGVSVYVSNVTESTGTNGIWKEQGATLPSGTTFSAGQISGAAPGSVLPSTGDPYQNVVLLGTNSYTPSPGQTVNIGGLSNSGNLVAANITVSNAASSTSGQTIFEVTNGSNLNLTGASHGVIVGISGAAGSLTSGTLVTSSTDSGIVVGSQGSTGTFSGSASFAGSPNGLLVSNYTNLSGSLNSGTANYLNISSFTGTGVIFPLAIIPIQRYPQETR